MAAVAVVAATVVTTAAPAAAQTGSGGTDTGGWLAARVLLRVTLFLLTAGGFAFANWRRRRRAHQPANVPPAWGAAPNAAPPPGPYQAPSSFVPGPPGSMAPPVGVYDPGWHRPPPPQHPGVPADPFAPGTAMP
ncbi:MAG TPA: hypothetical protein VIL36_17360, partial [Acidimicrobiales bacterium]